MKRIIAIIRPIMRDGVIAALHKMENFPGAVMTVTSGIRRGLHQEDKSKQEKPLVDYHAYIRIEIICQDHMAKTLVETIRANAYTGRLGDGKIFVSPIEYAIRIHDGKTGDEAI